MSQVRSGHPHFQYNAPWMLEERRLLAEFIKENVIPKINGTVVGIATILAALDVLQPEWFCAVSEGARRKLISYTMHDMRYRGNTRGHSGRITSWIPITVAEDATA